MAGVDTQEPCTQDRPSDDLKSRTVLNLFHDGARDKRVLQFTFFKTGEHFVHRGSRIYLVLKSVQEGSAGVIVCVGFEEDLLVFFPADELEGTRPHRTESEPGS